MVAARSWGCAEVLWTSERCALPTGEVLWVSAAKRVNIDELRRRVLTWLDDPT